MRIVSNKLGMGLYCCPLPVAHCSNRNELNKSQQRRNYSFGYLMSIIFSSSSICTSKCIFVATILPIANCHQVNNNDNKINVCIFACNKLILSTDGTNRRVLSNAYRFFNCLYTYTHCIKWAEIEYWRANLQWKQNKCQFTK